jgi:hypothetical protein
MNKKLNGYQRAAWALELLWALEIGNCTSCPLEINDCNSACTDKEVKRVLDKAREKGVFND